jgi:hypothetical protein
LHLHFLCIYDFHFLHCFSVLVVCLNFKIHLFVLHAAFHQNANFPR